MLAVKYNVSQRKENMREAPLLPNRKNVLPNKSAAEWENVCDTLEYIIKEINKATSNGTEPDYIEVEFLRTVPTVADRYTDYVLGKVVDYLKAAGWLETSFSLENGNKTIKLWIK